MQILTGFLVAVVVALVVYVVSTIVPFLKPHANLLALATFAIVVLLHVIDLL